MNAIVQHLVIKPILGFLFARPILFSLVVLSFSLFWIAKGILPIPAENNLQQISGIVEKVTAKKKGETVSYAIKVQNDQTKAVMKVEQGLLSQEQVQTILNKPVIAKYHKFIIADRKLLVLEASGGTIIAYENAKQKIQSSNKYYLYWGAAAFIGFIVLLFIGIRRRNREL